MTARGASFRPLNVGAASHDSAGPSATTPTSSRCIEARDCGKPLTQARADVAALRALFRVLRRRTATSCTATTIPYADGYTVLTWREPHGVTGHIIPWNYPLQIFGRSVGGALAAGNACVVKPAEDACLSLLRVAELAADAGLPAGALNIVTGLGARSRRGAGRARRHRSTCRSPGRRRPAQRWRPRLRDGTAR